MSLIPLHGRLPLVCAALLVTVLACTAPVAAGPDDPLPEDPPCSDAEADAIFYMGWWGDAAMTWEGNSELSPFLTLEQTRYEVRRYISTHASQRILIKIAGGFYPQAVPVVFTGADSGWTGMPVTYVAYNPAFFDNPHQDDVLFSGGVELHGWKDMGDGLYICSVPESVTDVRDVSRSRTGTW